VSNRGGYECFVKELVTNHHTECTVVLRKRSLTDDIIEKQGYLIQKIKSDNIAVKKML
jgi:hypothetical protein